MRKKFDFKDMKVVILAGGFGTRLSEYTKDIPKPMVRVGNSTIIEHKIKYYRSQGINDLMILLFVQVISQKY